MAHPSFSHLKKHRKRSGLTQRELAHLMHGCDSELGVRRYERYGRKPNLEAALACQVIFGTALVEVFPDIYAAVEASVIIQAHQLVEALSLADPTPTLELKLSTLHAIIERRSGAL